MASATLERTWSRRGSCCQASSVWWRVTWEKPCWNSIDFARRQLDSAIGVGRLNASLRGQKRQTGQGIDAFKRWPGSADASQNTVKNAKRLEMGSVFILASLPRSKEGGFESEFGGLNSGLWRTADWNEDFCDEGAYMEPNNPLFPTGCHF